MDLLLLRAGPQLQFHFEIELLPNCLADLGLTLVVKHSKPRGNSPGTNG